MNTAETVQPKWLTRAKERLSGARFATGSDLHLLEMATADYEALLSRSPQAVQEPTDKQIQDAVFAVLRKWSDDRAWDRYTRETGPYDVAELRAEVLEIIRAALAIRSLASSMAAPQGMQLVPIEAPPSLLPLLTNYGSLDHMGERDRSVIAERLRTSWAAILSALEPKP